MGCNDDPTGPKIEDEMPKAELPLGVTVSDPVGSMLGFGSLAAGAAGQASAASDPVYISASPGTLADAARITITNLATGDSQIVIPVEGGFDPVPLNGQPGDEINMVVERFDGTVEIYASPVPDRRRPRVVRTLPPNGATDVVLSVVVMIVFTEPVDAASLTDQTVRLRRGGEEVDGTLEVTDDGLRAWFRPTEPLAEGETYTLEIGTGILDLQGDPLESGFQATFTTGQGILLVSTGSYHTCALLVDGTAICWGDNALGQCARPFSEFELPQAVPMAHRFTALSSGAFHTCGVTVGGEVYCWGYNYFGQLGNGSTTNMDTPVLVSGGHSFVSLAIGTHHTCGVTTGGEAYCWGRHDFLQLGPGGAGYCVHGESSQPCSTTPMHVGNGFTSLTAGHLFTCGLKTDGGAYCWGGDHTGQLGTENTWQIESCRGYRCSRYVQGVSGGHTFVYLNSGPGHTCGITPEGATYCWGKNHYGQLGAGFLSEIMEREATPLPVVGGHTFIATVGGELHTCALTTTGPALCWGGNLNGEVGDGDPFGTYVLEPTEVVGSKHYLGLTASWGHTCGWTADGEVYCWGSNSFGQLGHDPSSIEKTPIPLLVPF